MYLISDLLKVSKYLPIIYTGHREIVLAKLILITAKLRKLHNLQFFLVCKKSFAKDFPYNFVIAYEDYEPIKRSFPKICVCQEKEGDDPVYHFANENKLDINMQVPENDQNGKIYFLGNSAEYKTCINKFSSSLLRTAIISNSIVECCNKASVVIGYENTGLIACAYKGKKVFLATDKNSDSFRMMFPKTNLLK
jgi:hypothetical protein